MRPKWGAAGLITATVTPGSTGLRVEKKEGRGWVSVIAMDWDFKFTNVQVVELSWLPRGELQSLPGLAVKCHLAHLNILQGQEEQAARVMGDFFQNDTVCTGEVIHAEEWSLQLMVSRESKSLPGRPYG